MAQAGKDQEEACRFLVRPAARFRSRHHLGDEGSVIETIIVFPFFFILLLVVVQGAMFYLAEQAATAGAAAGAMALAQMAPPSASAPCPQTSGSPGTSEWNLIAINATDHEILHASAASFIAPNGLCAEKVTGKAPSILPFSFFQVQVNATSYFAQHPTAGAGE
ncbi:MAG: TadE/TadG family type IV pilus assembly protein [Acidimicrobiales bacterium]